MGESMTGGAAPDPAAQAPMPMPAAAAPAARAGTGHALFSQAPYILMLLAAFGGVAYAGFSSQPNTLYWTIVTPVFGLLCIVAGWAGAPERGGRMRLVWTQALHWAGFLLAMLVLFRPEVQAALQGRGAEIGLLMLLALGTFVAGVHAGSWRIMAVGAVLGVSVPLLALVQQSVLLVLAAAALAGVAGASFVLLAARGRA
ncbi:hypothetical protein GXW74_03950 [Roseomonas eburnea]|uniref:Uncharacterized protein n=1 Tax=Neoroseomonas eburnea TaxID=1346889 RepID=A0A9X9X7D9_9PROT|nr:hypothetical protein [Neoroseomonas eburnea]MBR0679625.1 hypothetical protein [Neoroseomonas eburnea]